MKIKKLEWNKLNEFSYNARGVRLEYDIWKLKATYLTDAGDMTGGCIQLIGQYTDLESAKAACQKHFEEEVMEYLEYDSLNSEVPMPLLVQET